MKLLIILGLAIYFIGFLNTAGLVFLTILGLLVWSSYQNHLEMRQFTAELAENYEELNKNPNKDYNKQKVN
jgi:hypothetical protein